MTSHAPPSRRRAETHAARDRGSATAETAVVLPALLLVLAVCVWTLGLVSATLRCAEAARAAARTAARGEPAADVERAAQRTAGTSAEVTTATDGDLVTVRVSWSVRPPFPLLARLLPPATVRAEATAYVEPPRAEP